MFAIIMVRANRMIGRVSHIRPIVYPTPRLHVANTQTPKCFMFLQLYGAAPQRETMARIYWVCKGSKQID
jgi:hypothetical protein